MPEMPNVPTTPDVTTPAPVEGAKPVTPAEEMKTYTVNGKEYKVPISKIDERVQKSFGAEEAMKTAAGLQKAFDNFVAQAQDPVQLLGLLNHPSMKYDEQKQEMLVKSLLDSKKPRVINAVKEWIYRNEIEPKTMDPKDLELRELKAYRAQQEKMREEQENQSKAAEKEAAVKAAWNDYRTRIGQEMKEANLPQTEAVVARVARYALLYSKAGKPVDLKDCATRVKSDLLAEANERFSKADDDNILDGLPDGYAERISKALAKRMKGGTPIPEAKVASQGGSSTAALTKQMMKDLERGKKVF